MGARRRCPGVCNAQRPLSRCCGKHQRVPVLSSGSCVAEALRFKPSTLKPCTLDPIIKTMTPELSLDLLLSRLNSAPCLSRLCIPSCSYAPPLCLWASPEPIPFAYACTLSCSFRPSCLSLRPAQVLMRPLRMPPRPQRRLLESACPAAAQGDPSATNGREGEGRSTTTARLGEWSPAGIWVPSRVGLRALSDLGCF